MYRIVRGQLRPLFLCYIGNMIYESWRWIPGYELLYQVSSLGRVRSFARYKEPRLLRPYLDPRGYVQIVFTVNSKPRTYWLHRLVAQTFVPNASGKPEVNHIDGNKKNNCADNLEWVTSSENTLHGYRTGLLRPHGLRGEQLSKKLTEEKVLEIRQKHVPRMYSMQKLADEYGISRQMVKRIIYRQNWTHI